MIDSTEIAPVLVFTCGNPSRGDDALGPVMFDMLEQYKKTTSKLDCVDLLTDYQLQIEHTIDLEHRECVLFIDASVSSSLPYEFYTLQPEQDDSYTTHAMSPAAILAVYQKVTQQEPPTAYMLTLRGYEFGLGLAMTKQASVDLQKSFEFVKDLLESSIENWPEKHII